MSCLSPCPLPPVRWGTSNYRSRGLYGLLMCVCWWKGWPLVKQTTNKPVLCWALCWMSAQRCWATQLSGFFNRGHAAKIMRTYLKIYGLTWLLSLGRTRWVSQSELKPNVSVFHVYSFHKHSTYAVCSCYSERFFIFFSFFHGIWEICALGALSAESSLERTSDAGSLSNSFIKLSGRISSKVRQ